MSKRRRLSDLYVVGKHVKINDESGGDPVEIWIQKLNPVEHENALRRASVERAKYLAVVADHESEIWQATWADIHELAPTREQLLSIVLQDDLAKARQRIEAELADEDEWKEEDRLQSLVDAWQGTSTATEDHNAEGEREPLQNAFLRGKTDPDYERAAAVHKELEKFSQQAEHAWNGERDRLFADHRDVPTEELRDRAVETIIEKNAGIEMLKEFETQELFYATRDPIDRTKKYFGTRDEVLTIDPQVRTRLLAEYRTLHVEVQEGKDLPGIPGSSPQSDSSAPEGTPNSSGPEE